MPHDVEVREVDGGIGCRAHGRLGMECHTEPGGPEHVQIVGTVADSDARLQGNVLLRGPRPKAVLLDGAVHDLTDHSSGELPVDDLEVVGAPVVELEALGEGRKDLVETPGHNGDGVPGLVIRRDELFGAGGEEHGLAHSIDDLLGKSLQCPDAGVQALGEVELAPHGRLRDGGDLGALARVLGEELDDLLLDEGRIDVHDQELVLRIPHRCRDERGFRFRQSPERFPRLGKPLLVQIDRRRLDGVAVIAGAREGSDGRTERLEERGRGGARPRKKRAGREDQGEAGWHTGDSSRGALVRPQRKSAIVSTPMSNVLQLSGVSVVRGAKTLLDGVDWQVREGERWVVLGPNGAGKTTLLQLAAARMHPTRGTVGILDETLGRVDVFELRPRIGLASAALANQIPEHEKVLNVVVTAAYGITGRWREAYDRDDERRAFRLLNEWGMGPLLGRVFATLSEGERKRVQIARALMTDPELLLLDEPGAGLDLGGREELVYKLSELAQDEFAPALVLVTHHLEEVPPGFTHALLLREGKVVATGEIDAVLTEQNLSETFGLPLEVTANGGRYTAVRRAPAPVAV